MGSARSTGKHGYSRSPHHTSFECRGGTGICEFLGDELSLGIVVNRVAIFTIPDSTSTAVWRRWQWQWYVVHVQAVDMELDQNSKQHLGFVAFRLALEIVALRG